MEIDWNGTRQEIPDGTTISDLLAMRGLNPDTMIVELNDEICDKDAGTRILQPGDRVNVFRIVAGG